MKKTALTMALAPILALAIGTGSANAQTATRICAERDDVLAQLAARYGETRQSIGLGANSTVMEVFASRETGTWTITVTMPSGKTCLIASGDAFEGKPAPLPATKEDA